MNSSIISLSFFRSHSYQRLSYQDTGKDLVCFSPKVLLQWDLSSSGGSALDIQSTPFWVDCFGTLLQGYLMLTTRLMAGNQNSQYNHKTGLHSCCCHQERRFQEMKQPWRDPVHGCNLEQTENYSAWRQWSH